MMSSLHELGLDSDDKFVKAKGMCQLQAKIYRALLPRLRPTDARRFFETRLTRHGIPAPPNFDTILKDIKKLKPEVRWAAFVSWAGGWPTGQRMQDNRDPNREVVCRLGCDAPDSWAHYSRCVRMQCIFAHAAPPRVEQGLNAAGFWNAGAQRCEREKVLRCLAAKLHFYRTLRLGGFVLPAARQQQGTALLQVARAAAHKFKIRFGEKYGKTRSARTPTLIESGAVAAS